MAEITVVRPDLEAPPAQASPLATRQPLPTSPVIALVENGKPHARELLELLADELRGRIGHGDTILVRKPGASQLITEDEARDLAARAHVVITGVGDWGACTSCSLHDAILVERAGTPATVVITEAFQSVVASHAAKLGMPGYHSLVVPHPIWSRGTDGLRALAQGLAESGLAQLAT